MVDEETVQELLRKARDLADHFRDEPPGLIPMASDYSREEQYEKGFEYVEKVLKLRPNHGGALEILKDLHHARFISYIINYMDFKRNPDCIDEESIQSMHDIAMPLIDEYIDASLTLAEYPTDFPYQTWSLRENVFYYDHTVIIDPYHLFLSYLKNKKLSKSKLKIFYQMLNLKKWRETFPDTESKDYVLSEGLNLIADYQNKTEFSSRNIFESEKKDKYLQTPLKSINWQNYFDDHAFCSEEIWISKSSSSKKGKIRGEVKIGNIKPIEIREQLYHALVLVQRETECTRFFLVSTVFLICRVFAIYGKGFFKAWGIYHDDVPL